MPFLDHASELIAAYNRSPKNQAYNKVATEVYEARTTVGDPLSPQFEVYILKGLIGFDMARTMKGGSAAFATRLHNCLDTVRRNAALDHLGNRCLSSVDFVAIRPLIISAYNFLALAGTLHPEKQSHVEATKIFHWLFPQLFLMIDSNVAKAFRKHFGIAFRKSTQPGYSSERYCACLQAAQNEVHSFGVERFRQLEPTMPEARIFDKIAFVVGQQTG